MGFDERREITARFRFWKQTGEVHERLLMMIERFGLGLRHFRWAWRVGKRLNSLRAEIFRRIECQCRVEVGSNSIAIG